MKDCDCVKLPPCGFSSTSRGEDKHVYRAEFIRLTRIIHHKRLKLSIKVLFLRC